LKNNITKLILIKTLNQKCPAKLDHLKLIRLVRSGEEANIQLALQLAEDSGNPPAFGQYLEDLQPLYELAFKGKELDAAGLAKLFQLTRLKIKKKKLTVLPESIGELHNLQELDCSANQLKELPGSIGQLHNLQELYRGGNQLKALPESLG
jgi:Leucine-rich repeat (LRR) protein